MKNNTLLTQQPNCLPIQVLLIQSSSALPRIISWIVFVLPNLKISVWDDYVLINVTFIQKHIIEHFNYHIPHWKLSVFLFCQSIDTQDRHSQQVLQQTHWWIELGILRVHLELKKMHVIFHENTQHVPRMIILCN